MAATTEQLKKVAKNTIKIKDIKSNLLRRTVLVLYLLIALPLTIIFMIVGYLIIGLLLGGWGIFGTLSSLVRDLPEPFMSAWAGSASAGK